MERAEGISRVLRLKGCCAAIVPSCILWGKVHVLRAADEAGFGEPLPSGWEHSILSVIY